MYSNKPEPCAIVRTAASVITAVCLLLITTSMGIAGVYTIRTVNTINTDEIHNIVTKLSSTVDSMHSVSHMLTSSSHGSLIEQIPGVISEMKPLMKAAPQISEQALQLSVNFKEIVSEIKPLIADLPISEISRLFLEVVPTIQSLPVITTQLHSSSTDAYKTVLHIQDVLHSPFISFIRNSTDDLHQLIKTITIKLGEIPFEESMEFLKRHENILNDLSWVERLSGGVEDLSKSLNNVQFNLFLSEAEKWRNMSSHISKVVHKISNFL